MSAVEQAVETGEWPQALAARMGQMPEGVRRPVDRLMQKISDGLARLSVPSIDALAQAVAEGHVADEKTAGLVMGYMRRLAYALETGKSPFDWDSVKQIGEIPASASVLSMRFLGEHALLVNGRDGAWWHLAVIDPETGSATAVSPSSVHMHSVLGVTPDGASVIARQAPVGNRPSNDDPYCMWNIGKKSSKLLENLMGYPYTYDAKRNQLVAELAAETTIIWDIQKQKILKKDYAPIAGYTCNLVGVTADGMYMFREIGEKGSLMLIDPDRRTVVDWISYGGRMEHSRMVTLTNGDIGFIGQPGGKRTLCYWDRKTAQIHKLTELSERVELAGLLHYNIEIAEYPDDPDSLLVVERMFDDLLISAVSRRTPDDAAFLKVVKVADEAGSGSVAVSPTGRIYVSAGETIRIFGEEEAI